MGEHSAGGSQHSRHTTYLWFAIAMPILIPLTVVAFALVAVLWPFAVILALWQHVRSRHHLRQAGRLMDLATARQRITAGEGVVLVEVHYKGLGSTWYVDAATLADCPGCPLPMLGPRLDRPTYEQLFSETVRVWCEEHLPKIASRTRLVKVRPKAWQHPEAGLPNPAVLAVFFHEAQCFRV